MKATIIYQNPFFNADTIEETLTDMGAEITGVRAWTNELETINPLDEGIIVFMGGPMGVYEADIFPFLSKEIAILEQRLAKDLPTMGICLGSQMMAKALGADVYKGKQGPEIGWLEIQVNESGLQTPVKHLDASKTKMIQWHGDTFDFPDGATLLASSDVYQNQIFSYGKRNIALQCHPEVNEEILDYWILTGGFHGLYKTGQTLPDFYKETKQYINPLKDSTRLFVREWAESVVG